MILAPASTSRVLAWFFERFCHDQRMHPVNNRTQFEAIADTVGGNGRLIVFGSDIIVPGCILSHFRFGAYNFHPGPPAYPGWAPEHFAAHDKAKIFGATAHHMVERVDAGPIIGTELFPVPLGWGADQLAVEATRAVGRLLLRLGNDLARQTVPLPAMPIAWGDQRGTKAKLARLRQTEPGSVSADFLYCAPLQPAADAARR